MSKFTICFLTTQLLFHALSAQTTSPFIHVDQFGYLTNSNKVAVLSDPIAGFNSAQTYTAPATIELRDASTTALIQSFVPSQWNGGATHAGSGDRGWWVDFSAINTPGQYYLYDAVNNERSANFEINDTVYHNVLKEAGRMFYYNRCNMAKAAPYAEANWTDTNNFLNALQDANCRYVNDPGNAGLEKDLRGGWFDAGDYNKYVTFAFGAVHDLLAAYEQFPNAFSDSWNIPESGNGIPDVLDELKWELDWLLRMANPDGSVIIKMGSIDYADNAAAPPSANTDPRYYGPTCSAAEIAAASMFAHAARVFGGIASMNAYAQTLENAAVASWNHVLPQLNSGALDLACDDGTIKAGDADWTVDLQMENALSAAIYLYALTGNAMYQTYIAAHINDAEQMSTGFWGPYKVPVGDALLTYASLPAADAIIATNIQTSFSTDASNNYNGYYGFNTGDLYRAYMPGWSYHWGSNNPKASYGNLNLQLNHFGLNTVNANDYENKAEEQLHYFHGVNPLGMVHLSNMYGKGAENCVNEIYHTWFNDGTAWDNALTSTYGPAPGFLTGGTNPSFSVTSLTPPFNQPNQKAYLDFNDGWPNNSWEITEPAIYYQAAYLRLLAGFVDVTVSTPLPVELLNFSAKELDGNVTLSWESISEINSSHFVVERSRDGSQFTTIATQEALGVNQSGHQYKMEDRPLIGGRLYYRLKMVDLDGRFSYSSLEQVNVQIERLHIFPNPFAEQLTVQIPNGSNLQDERWFVRIYDQLGRQILFEESPKLNNGQLELDLSAWEDGIYFLNIALPAQGFAETQTLMKN